MMVDEKLRTRPATADDYEACLALDPNYQTNRVWQMSANHNKQRIDAHFQMAHLPRATEVTYPFTKAQRTKQWYEANYVAVGETDNHICAYIALTLNISKPAAWVTALIIAPEQRRQELGSRLLSQAQRWARQRQLSELTTAVQTKNYPAIQFCHHHGFTFCGYHEYWFPSGDIALFFRQKI